MGQQRGLKWEEECLIQDDAWYGTYQAQRIANNMLLFQNDDGGWPKNINMTQPVDKGIKKLDDDADLSVSTIDNGATVTQMRFLSRVFSHVNNPKYAASVINGFDYLIDAQYDNGGWPQFYPLRKGYYSHITFNDEAMVNVLFLLNDIISTPEQFPFVDKIRKNKATESVQKGIECILKCQIEVEGELTAWCAQHDEKTFKPAKARSYELPSISGKESVGIVEFLLEIENPDDRIINSIQRAIKWFDSAKIEGIRKKWVRDESIEGGYNKIMFEDPNALPIWGRFYEIGSNQYFFCDRDGSIHYNLAELSAERRIEYAWLGYWPESLLSKSYPEWQLKWAPDENVLQK
ncbi:MAG: pectate lyase [Calditrichaceae bacterium]|nr:pectate lyase [Calditrichaceae bacterium]